MNGSSYPFVNHPNSIILQAWVEEGPGQKWELMDYEIKGISVAPKL